MDQSFLAYYEAELGQLRHLSQEFAELHPTVARNLSLDSVPCPDPYVERLLEGVAFLAARTRLKLDYEASRHVRALLDALYPDLAAPAPAMTMAELQPGPQVTTMLDGHRVEAGTRLVAGLREGIRTRAVYTTAQPVDLWPIRVADAEYLQDRGALKAAGLSDSIVQGAEAGLKLTLERTGAGTLGELSLDKLDLYLGNDSRAVQLFDAIFGSCREVLAAPEGQRDAFRQIGGPNLVGLASDEAMLPRVRASFEGYRLLREYFLMPERFHFVRLSGLQPTIASCDKRTAEIILLFSRPEPRLTDIKAEAFRLFVAPIVNLFERECNIVELDRRRTSHVVHADRTRPRDFEIFRVRRVEDADQDGAAARLSNVYALEKSTQCPFVFSTDRSPRRPSDDEVDAGQLRTSYRGDDFLISVARKPGSDAAASIRRLDIRALCTNRDLPILDDTPVLSLEAGDPVAAVTLLKSLRRPRSSLSAELPSAKGGEADADDLTWRWIAQLSLAQLSVTEEGAGPLQSLIALYADRGDPAYARHGRSVTSVTTKRVIDRLLLPGPICYGHGTEITLHVDEDILSGSSNLLLSALLAHLFARDAAVNSFVRVVTRLSGEQRDVAWAPVVGTRSLA